MRTLELAGEEKPAKRAAPLVIAAAVLVLISAFGSWAFLSGHREAYLHVAGKSSLAAGALTVLVDGEQAYTHRFSASGIGSLVDRLVEKKHQTFETHIKVDGGVHRIVAAVFDDAGASLSERILVVDLKPGETRELSVLVGDDFGAPLSLKTD